MIRQELPLKNINKSGYVMVYCLDGKPYSKNYDTIEDVIKEYNILDKSEIKYDYVYVFRATHIYEDIKMKN